MSHRLCLFANLEGISEKQQIPLLLKTLKRVNCRRTVQIRRLKKCFWAQLDGFAPEDAESAASAIAADLKTLVVLLEHESSSGAFRYIKYDWKDGKYGSEVIRWVYGYQSIDGWETCLGDVEAMEFTLIVSSKTGGASKHARSKKEKTTSFVVPPDQLKPPSVESLGQLLNLPGIGVSDGAWTEEQTYQPEPQTKVSSFFELFNCKLWELDDVDRLIQEGVDPNQRLADADPGCFRELAEMTPLEDVISTIDRVQLLIQLTVEKLLQAGANPNQLGTIQTPLADAVDSGVSSLVKTLLKGGASVNIPHNRDGDCHLKDLLHSAPTKQIEQSLKTAAANEAQTPAKTKPRQKNSKR